MEKSVEASRVDFCQLAWQHAKSNVHTSDLGTVTKVTQALVYVSMERATDYLREVATNLRPWHNAKGLLEKLVEGLTAQSPRIDPTLFAIDHKSWWDLPHEIKTRLLELGQTAAAVYNNLDMAFVQREEFRQLKQGALSLLQQYAAELTARSAAYQAVESLKPKVSLESAVEAVTAEGERVFEEFAQGKRVRFGAAMPVTAMLYLLQIAKNPEEKRIVQNALTSYQQRLAGVVGYRFSPTGSTYQTLLQKRIALAVTAVAA